MYPSILNKNLPKSLFSCLISSLEEDPKSRTSFLEMYDALVQDTSVFGVDDDLDGASSWIVEEE
jgi:hypothetical protein